MSLNVTAGQLSVSFALLLTVTWKQIPLFAEGNRRIAMCRLAISSAKVRLGA